MTETDGCLYPGCHAAATQLRSGAVLCALHATGSNSLLPLDIGFDLRLHDLFIRLWDTTPQQYLDRRNRPRLALGTREQIARTLRRAGYHVSLQQQGEE